MLDDAQRSSAPLHTNVLPSSSGMAYPNVISSLAMTKLPKQSSSDASSLPPRRSRPTSRVPRAGVGIGLALALSGCPDVTEKPNSACTKRFEKCQLPDGPLGVCGDAPCADPEESGCLECQSQH